MDHPFASTRTNMNRVIGAGIVVVLIGAAALYAWRAEIYAALDAARLIPHPETYTELYLNNTLEIPKQVAAGEEVPFSFTIRNVEGREVAYHYIVSAEHATSTPIILKDDTVSLLADTAVVIGASYRFDASSTPAVIRIRLVDRPEYLHFALPSRQ